MIDDFMSVLEDYAGVNLHSESGRKSVAQALIDYMCEHHIVMYTDLDGAMSDPNMIEFIKNCGCNVNQTELQLERGL
jgi:hypothetical protein